MWEEHPVQLWLEEATTGATEATGEAVESNGASGFVDVKTLIIGRKGTISGWTASEGSVTKFVYKRFLVKEAQKQDP